MVSVSGELRRQTDPGKGFCWMAAIAWRLQTR